MHKNRSKKDYLKAVQVRQRKKKELMEVAHHLKSTCMFRQIKEI
jgi:cell shape-determining protein MreC